MNSVASLWWAQVLKKCFSYVPWKKTTRWSRKTVLTESWHQLWSCPLLWEWNVSEVLMNTLTRGQSVSLCVLCKCLLCSCFHWEEMRRVEMWMSPSEYNLQSKQTTTAVWKSNMWFMVRQEIDTVDEKWATEEMEGCAALLALWWKMSPFPGKQLADY